MKRAIASLVTPLILGLAAPAAAQTPLSAGDTVQFDLSALPRSYEGAGKVICKGTVVRATGPQEERCDRTFRFQVPSGAASFTYLFRPKAGGRETSIDLPITRESRAVSFTAPSDGTLTPPAKVGIPPEAADEAARSQASSECEHCEGGDFSVEEVEVTEVPKPVGGTPRIQLRIQKGSK